ncbi:helix-turn-helix domain-containing protein [Streptacidiphilus sp. ASG 303]|uniref:helix-turn-helix domain-containing protein n=1 Tax=Streptacidiphilus sp. ASG 303 TaxID=2896847 RepID=UPI0027DF7E96|nr:helix-turn-helix domain-containing protein [Streptacidiphilus sp. ASG 303]
MPFPEDAYAYVLGLYLGDGHIVSRKRQHHLAISCCDAWPGLIEAAEAAVKAVLPRYATRRRRRRGCTDVESHTRHWVCMLPQHGPGRKHEREIALASWQREIVRRHPWPLIRGLIHSDGCRITNWATRTVAGERKRYEYPRYFFTNTSADIVRLFTDTLDAVGVEWRVARRVGAAVNVSVARRGSVALMDRFVGAKY